MPRSNAYHAVACAKRNVHAMSVLTTLVFALKLASRIPFPCPTAISEGDTETQIPKDTETQFHRYTETRERLHVLGWPGVLPSSITCRPKVVSNLCHCYARSRNSGALLHTITHFRGIVTHDHAFPMHFYKCFVRLGLAQALPPTACVDLRKLFGVAGGGGGHRVTTA